VKERAWTVSTTVFLALAAVFVGVSILVIFSQAVYMPYWDQWDWLYRYYLGSESLFAFFFTPINGHIIAIPGLVYRIDLALFEASNVANLSVMLACIAAIACVLRSAFSGLSEQFRGRTISLFFATVLVLMFWFYNWENLFWPFQVHQQLSLLFCLLALFALSKALVKEEKGERVVGLAVALSMALLATASFGVGLAVWGSALVLVGLSRWPNLWKWASSAVAVCILALIGAYLSRWLEPGAAHFDPLGALHFVAMFLGSPFLQDGNLRVEAAGRHNLILVVSAGYLGLCLAGANAYCVLRARRDRPLRAGELFFVGIMVFSLAAAAMAALTRAGGAFSTPALASRYGSMVLLFWISAIPLFVASLSLSKTTMRSYETVVPIGLLLLITLSQSSYLDWWTRWRNWVEFASASLVTEVPDREYLGYIFPGDRPETVESVSAVLLRNGSSALAEGRARFIGHSLSEFGTPAGSCPATVVETKGLREGVRFKGWLTDGATSFDRRSVFVTDANGRIIGIGALEKRWQPRVHQRDRERIWVAYAPVTLAAAHSVRLYMALEEGLCSVAELESRQDEAAWSEGALGEGAIGLGLAEHR
jgi:hypothetical protein